MPRNPVTSCEWVCVHTQNICKINVAICQILLILAEACSTVCYMNELSSAEQSGPRVIVLFHLRGHHKSRENLCGGGLNSSQ